MRGHLPAHGRRRRRRCQVVPWPAWWDARRSLAAVWGWGVRRPADWPGSTGSETDPCENAPSSAPTRRSNRGEDGREVKGLDRGLCKRSKLCWLDPDLFTVSSNLATDVIKKYKKIHNISVFVSCLIGHFKRSEMWECWSPCGEVLLINTTPTGRRPAVLCEMYHRVGRGRWNKGTHTHTHTSNETQSRLNFHWFLP